MNQENGIIVLIIRKSFTIQTKKMENFGKFLNENSFDLKNNKSTFL